MLGVALVCSLSTLALAWRASTPDEGALPAFAVIVLGLFAWLLWIARPWLLPVGTGPDLTHHLLLIRHIETHWRLVHDASLEPYLGEMMYYTPGSHVLAALGGAWSGTNGLRALHPVLAATVALKTGFVFLIARRLLPPEVPRVPIAAMGALTLFSSQTFFLGSFVEYAFAAQAVAELFVVVMWWALTAWDQEPGMAPMIVFGVSGAAVFLTWPVLIGPPLLALGILVVLSRLPPFRTRVTHAAVAGAPVLLYAGLFMAGRAAWVQLASTGGKTAWPVPAAYGWPFLAASAAGLLFAALRRRTRSAAVFAMAILAQAAVLYWLATRAHNVPYMALKLFYALVFVQAALAALTIGEVWRITATVIGSFHVGRLTGTSVAIAWLLTAGLSLVVARSVAGAPRSLALEVRPAVSRPLELAGEWARANLPRSCVEYLVGDDETAYWLHLAVLGNPRMSPRTGENDTYALVPALVRWLTPGGLPYAIADLPALPRDVRDELDVIERFDTAAVVRRHGPTSCPGAGQ
jgi:hypothetical protein